MTTSCPTCRADVPTLLHHDACPHCGTLLPPETPSIRTGAYTPQGEPNDALPPAVAVPGFEILGVLGRGGMGVVYKARQTALGRTVALKMVLRGQHLSAAERARFRAEAEAVAAIRHPHVVQVFEFGEHAGQPFFAMELLDGGTLADVLASGRREPAVLRGEENSRLTPAARQELIPLIEKIARGVAAAHDLGIVHRDLKPGNVLLSAAGEPKVTDFGLAKRGTADLTQSGAIMGTPQYMSPEQAGGRTKFVGPPADVWALGVILYECLTGKRPFDADGVESVLSRVLLDDPVRPRKVNAAVPRDLELICLKCLEKEPADRYPSAAELADDLQRFLDDKPVSARPPSAIDRVRKFTRRNKVLVGGIAATLVVLALGVVGTSIGLLQARAETKRANDAASREAAEARRANAALAQTHATAAPLASQRGRWREALHFYREAVRLGAPDEVELRLGALECHQALYDFPQLRAELAELAKRPDLGKNLGRVKLYQGLLEFYGSDATADPVGTFRAAVAAGLPLAEESYARGVLAANLPEMIDRLRDAIRADPFHARAHDLLIMAQLLAGRVPEARDTLIRFEFLAPNALNAIGYRMLERALSGDLPEALRVCDTAKPIVGEDGAETLRTFATLFHELGREGTFGEANPDLQGRLFQQITSVGPKVSRLMKEDRLTTAWSSFNMIRMGIFRPLADLPVFKVTTTFEALAFLSNADAMRKLVEEAARVLPMGALLFAQAGHRQAAGDLAGAAVLYRKALATPSLVPIARRARLMLLGALGTLYEKSPPGPEREARRQEAAAVLREIAREGLQTADARDSFVGWAQSLNEPGLALAAAEDWVRVAPTDPKAQSALSRTEQQLGAWARMDTTLEKRVKLEPTQTVLRNARTVAAMRQRTYSRALAAALDALAHDPADEDAADNIQVVRDQLDITLEGLPYLREKARLWQPLYLAQTGNVACAVASLPDLSIAPPQVRLAAAGVYSRAASFAAMDKQAELATELIGKAAELVNGVPATWFAARRARVGVIAGDDDFAYLRSRPECPPALTGKR